MENFAKEFTFKRGLVLKNKMVMAPMTTKMSYFNGKVTPSEVAYYHQRAGEVGMIITGAANVQQNGKCWEGELSVESQEMIPSLNQLASGIKVNGTKAILQIFHGGRRTTKAILRGEQPVSASDIPAEIPGSEVPRSLTTAEVYEVIENFKKATLRAIAAGFDGVEIHGANTYLLQQFFSPHSNRRKDEFGGSLEKRFHFIDLLVDGVIETVEKSGKQNFIVGYRFSPEEYETPGISFEDTLYLVDRLAAKNLDYLHVSLNRYDLKSRSEDYQEKTMLAYLHEKINSRLPLIGVGNIWSEKDVTNCLLDSELVAIGTGLLFDPHFVGKILNKQDQYIRKNLLEIEREDLRIADGTFGFICNRKKDQVIFLPRENE